MFCFSETGSIKDNIIQEADRGNDLKETEGERD